MDLHRNAVETSCPTLGLSFRWRVLRYTRFCHSFYPYVNDSSLFFSCVRVSPAAVCLSLADLVRSLQPFSHEEHSAFLDAMERYGQENTGSEWEKISQVSNWSAAARGITRVTG